MAAIDLVIHQARLADGKRLITEVSVIDKHQRDASFRLRQLFSQRSATDGSRNDVADWSGHHNDWTALLDAVAADCGRRSDAEVRR